ncbi:reverse transcriptase domain-containing protein [Tanacetum coccineum]
MEKEGNSANNGQGDAKDILTARCPKSARRCFRMDYNPYNTSAENINYRRRNLQHRTSTECVQSHRTGKTKKISLAPERNEVFCTQVEELVEAGVLREVKYQTWHVAREPHPLPTTELGAENLHKYRLKCFLDAYKGYHQIPMAEKNEEKTAFFTVEGVFCYKRLPFGLKNTGATYQRLTDKVFGSQIGRNMEVNANNMVIKSNSEEEMLADIEETLGRLQAINLKLNPRKCSFGVKEGIYSGHLITKQGIRADPSKIPLEKRKKGTPFHENPIKLHEWKDGSMDIRSKRSLLKNERMFRVTANNGYTNQRRDINRVPRSLRKNVSEVLMAERGKKQTPVYFVSRTLHGVEQNYPKLEKLILSLVYAARKLRRYFQAHPIQVLREQEIEFKGRNSIKGQILVDFLAETSSTKREEEENREAKRKEPEPKKTWKLFTDGASSSDGLGAELMLVNPEGKEYMYALRFEFETTNNEAKYEALIVGLRIAKEMQIQELNKKADALSKLASMTFSKLAKEVLVEVIQTKSVAEKEVTDIVKKDEDSWMVPIREYLKEGTLPKYPQKARKLRIKAPLYRMIEERLYQRSPTNNVRGCKSKTINIYDRQTYGKIRMGTYSVQIWKASDNGKQFAKGTFPVFCKKLRTLQAFTFVYHPQANGASKAEYQGKVGPTWEGPYRVRKAYEDGAYKLETLSGEAIDRTWNGTNLRADN